MHIHLQLYSFYSLYLLYILLQLHKYQLGMDIEYLR